MLVALVILVLFPVKYYSQNISSGSAFLNLPHNVYQHSLGEAAHLEGLEGLNANPAATTLSYYSSDRYMESGINISSLPGDILFSNLSYLYWAGDKIGTLAGSAAFLYYGNIPLTDINGNSQGELSAYDLYVKFNYSRQIWYGILIGGSAKVIQEKLASFSAIGMAGDFGIKKKIKIKQNELWFSASANNIGTGIKFDVESTPFPLKIHTSTSFMLKDYLPRWMQITLSPQFNYFIVEKRYNFTLGGDFMVSMSDFNISILSKYQISDLQDEWSIGTGFSYGYIPYAFNIGFAINPFTFGKDFAVSLKLSYSFEKKKLSRVKPVDFSFELKNSESEELGKDSNEIIIELDGPAFEVSEP